MSYARTAVTRMTLDMSRLDLQRSETVTLGDTNRRWEVTLINGGAPFRLPPNWTAALTGIKPDGTGLLNGCSVADGKIVYDFAAGAEIATCVGNYPVQFDIWDEVGDLVASPKIYVNVLADVRPHAELDSEGQYTLIGDAIKKIDDMGKDVDLLADTALVQGDDIAALKEKVTTAGTVTIPTEEWSDNTPTTANFKIEGLGNGMTALLYPSDEATRKEASRVKLSAYPQLYMGTEGNQVQVVVSNAEVVPTKALNLDYNVIKTDNVSAQPRIALIGVDAYGEGGGGTGSGVDETAVKKIINTMLGNVANERQYSAANPPPYPVTSVNGKTGAVTLSIPSKASDISAEEAGAVSTHNADQIAHPYLSGRVATALDRISGLDTNIEEINTSVAERLKTADLAAKLDDYKAAQGLVSNTTSNLTNYYLKSEIYTKEEVAALLSAIPKFEIKVVTSLPTSNISLTTVYLVKDTTEGGGLYTEYIYINGAWEELGSQSLDLSGYVTDEELDNLLKSYATLTKVSELIADALEPYATDEEVAEAIRVATVNFVTGSQVTTAINEALESYYTSAQVDAEIAAQIKTALTPYITKEDADKTYQPAGDYLTPDTGDLRYAKPTDIPTVPTHLPNPNPLTINGQTYDGSSPVEVTIEGGGSDADLAAEVTRMKEMQPNLFAETYQTGNLLDKTLVNKAGYYVNSSGGFTALTSATATEEYIDISKAEGTHLAVYACHNTQTATSYWRAVYRMCFYNADKVKIGYHDGGGQKDYAYYGVMEIPEGAVYVRVSFTSGTNVDNYVIRRGPADMELPYWTPYEPVREAVVVPEDLNTQLDKVRNAGKDQHQDNAVLTVTTLNNSATFSENDIAFVGDELWVMKDDSTYTNGTRIFRYRVDGETFEYLGYIDSDFGHLNTMDYCAANDCFIFGNGGNDEVTTGNYFVVIKHPLTIPYNTTTTIADLVAAGQAIKYDLDSTIGSIGFKVQALWGDSNLGANNRVILIASNTTVIKEVLLSKTDGEFDGGLTVVKSHTELISYGVQGADYWGGYLYIGGQGTTGSGRYQVCKVSMADPTQREIIAMDFYMEDGTVLSGCVQGVCIEPDYIWIATNASSGQTPSVAITKYRR